MTEIDLEYTPILTPISQPTRDGEGIFRVGGDPAPIRDDEPTARVTPSTANSGIPSRGLATHDTPEAPYQRNENPVGGGSSSPADKWVRPLPPTRDTPEAALRLAVRTAWGCDYPRSTGGHQTCGCTDERIAAILAAMPDWMLVPSDVGADAQRWRDAEAEGHIVTFSVTGYGLQHPPSCRPDLIGCWFNKYLASRGGPEEDPGRYRMTRHKGHAEYAAPAPSEP